MQSIDWKNLPFGYTDTDYNVRCYYRNGSWGKIEVSSSNVINIHMAASPLHYGQKASKASRLTRAGRQGPHFSAATRTPAACRTRRTAC